MAGIISNFLPSDNKEYFIERYEENDKKTTLDILMDALKEGTVEWSVGKRSKKGDLVYFYCAKKAINNMKKVFNQLKKKDNPQIREFAYREKELYKRYSGHIVAWGELVEDAYKEEEVYDVQWNSYYAKIRIYEFLDKPLPYSEFNVIKRVNQGAITYLTDTECDALQNMIRTYNSDLDAIVEVSDERFSEGKQIEIYGKKYERNPKVRKEFLSLQRTPYQCAVCGFDYEKKYGELGKGFIEVHHKRPLFVDGNEKEINLKEDLVCLCSNCHRMIHRNRNKVMTVEELRGYIKNSN